jgi:hypothetical protein
MPTQLQYGNNFTTVQYETCLLQELAACQNKVCRAANKRTPHHPNVVVPKHVTVHKIQPSQPKTVHVIHGKK